MKSTVHLASHNLMTNISECVANPDILCAHRALSCILPSRVEVTHCPSGSFAVIGFKVCLSSSTGASDSKKLLVAPLSKIVHCLISFKLTSIVFSNEFAACE